MKSIERVFCLIVVCVVLVGCEALGVPPQSAAPSVNQAITDTPSSIPEQLTFPQMTGTALAFPTVIYPTEKPLTPEEFFPLSQLKTTSPDGDYVVTCDYSFPTLFHSPTKTVIATTDRNFGCDSERSSWSQDSSYVFLVEGITEDIYRWRTDGSQPEFLEINKIVEPKKLHYPDWSVKMRWSPNGKYLAIQKFDLYVVTPDDEESFKNPLLIQECAGCFEDFRWVTSNLLMYDYFRSYDFVQIPSGKGIGWLGRSGGICTAQIPLISPDEHWMTFDSPWCGGGEPGPNEYRLANLEDGSVQVFSQSFADGIDFIGWNKDGSEFYMISRPTEINAQADPRTSFGLLTMNPQTLQTQNLFEQAWYVAFNEDMSWAYVIFPSKNNDGSLSLDGGLWQVGTTRLIGRQVMAHSLEETFLNPYSSPDTAYMYSPSGQELGFSAATRIRRLPAVWSHDNTRVAIVNPEHQLIVITLNGDIQVVGELDDVYLWINTIITWSDDDKVLDVDGTKWTVP
jgi:hypothetical protein